MILVEDRRELPVHLAAHEVDAIGPCGVEAHAALDHVDQKRIHLEPPARQQMPEHPGIERFRMGQEGIQHAGVPTERNVLHVAPETAKDVCGSARVSLDLRIDRLVAEIERDGDTPPLDPGQVFGDANAGPERAGILRMRPRHYVLHERGIADGTGERAEVEDRLAREIAIERVASERRLVADQPACRSGDPDRAAGVGAVGEHGHAGRERCSRPA